MSLPFSKAFAYFYIASRRAILSCPSCPVSKKNTGLIIRRTRVLILSCILTCFFQSKFWQTPLVWGGFFSHGFSSPIVWREKERMYYNRFIILVHNVRVCWSFFTVSWLASQPSIQLTNHVSIPFEKKRFLHS